jgi:hypothetical protein
MTKKKILECRMLPENKRKNRFCKRIDHAKFIFAGEILKTDMGKDLSQKISKDNEYLKDDADALSCPPSITLNCLSKLKNLQKKGGSDASASDNT